MGKRPSVILLLVGLVMITPAALTVSNSVSISGYSYLIMSAALALVPICGLAVIAWGLWGLLRKKNPNA